METSMIVIALLLARAGGSDTNCQVPEYYSQIDLGSLRESLHSLIADALTVPYTSTATDVWDALKVIDVDDDNPDNVILIYSQMSRSGEAAGFSDGWNREHTWPKSYGVYTNGPDFSDLHHIYPADWNVNSARNNLYFDHCNPDTNPICISPAHAEAENTTAKTRDFFQPPKSVRGDIARAMFYMETRYDGSETNTLNLSLSECPCSQRYEMGVLSTLLQWHIEDPVDTRELERNFIICDQYQGNRNPFIDFPEYVEIIWGAPKSVDCSNVTCELVQDNSLSNDTEILSMATGDAFIVGFNSENPDQVSLAILVDIMEEGSNIYISDKGWQGSSFTATEGILIYTVPAEGLAAGTVIHWSKDYPHEDWLTSSKFALSTSADQMYVYVANRTSTEFISAVSWKSSGWDEPDAVASSSDGALPEELAEGPTVGLKDELRRNLTMRSNWKGSNSQRYEFYSENFTVLDNSEDFGVGIDQPQEEEQDNYDSPDNSEKDSSSNFNNYFSAIFAFFFFNVLLNN